MLFTRRARLVLLALGFAVPAFAAQAETDLGVAYAQIRARATELAGAPLDMPKRAAVLNAIYLDSKGNHQFPLVALHGALWGYRFFAVTGPIGDAVSYRYFYDAKERARRKDMLRRFSNAFAETNRSVFIDTYTNYYFTKAHGAEAGAERFVRPELLAALNRVHEAASGERRLSEDELKQIFLIALRYEQEGTVGPRIRAAVEDFDCPVMESLALRPVVHFAYFPAMKFFFFRDFSSQPERVRRATAAYDLAVEAGWDRVEAAIDSYGVKVSSLE